MDGNRQLSDGEKIYCASCGKGMTVVKGESTAETHACQPHTLTYFCSKECSAKAEPLSAQGEAGLLEAATGVRTKMRSLYVEGTAEHRAYYAGVSDERATLNRTVITSLREQLRVAQERLEDRDTLLRDIYLDLQMRAKFTDEPDVLNLSDFLVQQVQDKVISAPPAESTEGKN